MRATYIEIQTEVLLFHLISLTIEINFIPTSMQYKLLEDKGLPLLSSMCPFTFPAHLWKNLQTHVATGEMVDLSQHKKRKATEREPKKGSKRQKRK